MDDERQNEPSLAGLAAEWDQTLAAFRDMARGVRAYFDELREQGFSKSEALHLAATYQAKMLEIGLKGGGSE